MKPEALEIIKRGTEICGEIVDVRNLISGDKKHVLLVFLGFSSGAPLSSHSPETCSKWG